MKNKKQIIKALREDIIRLGSAQKQICKNENHNMRMYSVALTTVMKEFNINCIPYEILYGWKHTNNLSLSKRYEELKNEAREKKIDVPYYTFVIYYDTSPNYTITRMLRYNNCDEYRKHILTSMHILYNTLRNSKNPHLHLNDEGSEFEYFKYANTVNELLDIYSERVESEKEVCEDA